MSQNPAPLPHSKMQSPWVHARAKRKQSAEKRASATYPGSSLALCRGICRRSGSMEASG